MVLSNDQEPLLETIEQQKSHEITNAISDTTVQFEIPPPGNAQLQHEPQLTNDILTSDVQLSPSGEKPAVNSSNENEQINILTHEEIFTLPDSGNEAETFRSLFHKIIGLRI